jgi:hypothetical protein
VNRRSYAEGGFMQWYSHRGLALKRIPPFLEIGFRRHMARTGSFRPRGRILCRVARTPLPMPTIQSMAHNASRALSRVFRILRPRRRQSPFFERSHSHTRNTRQPLLRNARVTSRSRALLRLSFAAHQSERVFGKGACFGLGQPCQKQPSTNKATRSWRKTKSGLPNIRAFRRQPMMRCARKSEIIRISVSLFPLPRIADITALRLVGVKTSGIGDRRKFREPLRAVSVREHQPPWRP